MDDGQWHFYTATVQRNGSILFYVDGQLLSSACYGSTAPWGNASPGDISHLAGEDLQCPCDMCLGESCENNGSCGLSEPWVGDLDEVAYYNRALTATEVRDAYRGRGTACAPACTQDSDCAVGPCNGCRSGAQLCLAPLGPVASLVPGACKAVLPDCTPPSTVTCGIVGAFPVGNLPQGLAFDGTNLWVTNSGNGTVSKLSLSGATVGTYPVGAVPAYLAFDGMSMWVVNNAGSSVAGSVTRLSLTGATLGTYPLTGNLQGIAFDGTNMWVVDSGWGGGNSVMKLSPTGATLGKFPVGKTPQTAAFDGTNMWVTNAADGTVTKLSLTGAPLGTFPVGNSPFAIAFDGTNMWVANAGSANVTKLSPTGATLGTFAAAAPVSIAFDGVSMWTASSTTVTKLSPAGATLGTYPAGAGAYGNIAFDGIHMWVSSYNAAVVTEL